MTDEWTVFHLPFFRHFSLDEAFSSVTISEHMLSLFQIYKRTLDSTFRSSTSAGFFPAVREELLQIELKFSIQEGTCEASFVL